MDSDRTMTTDHQRAMSPREASRQSGVSRSTIMRALSSRKLKAIRNNRNAWQIMPGDLEEWLSAHREPARTMATDHAEPDQVDQLHEAKAERDAALARADAAERARDQAEADRDRWQAMAEKLADRPGWWAQLWRRR